MRLPVRFGFASFFLTSALAQLNLDLIISDLPLCSIKCSTPALASAGCALADIPSCFCTNMTLQAHVSACIQTSCNRSEIFTATNVSQTLMCQGVPYPSRSSEIKRVVGVITAVAFVTVILRVISRLTVSRIWWDDWAILTAAIIIVPTTAITLYNANRGFGEHVWNVPPQNVRSMQQLYYVSQILYVLLLNLTKISILLLFLRIFPGDRFRLVTKIALVWMICHTLGFFFAVTLQCIPVSSIWEGDDKAKCVNSSAMIYIGAGLSILDDLLIILLPVRELKGLNLTTKKKIAVIFMFALGSFACITSMARLKYAVYYQVQALDATWTSTDLVIWSVLETYTAVICASLMAIRPLLSRWMSLLQGNVPSNTELFQSGTRPHKTGSSRSAAARWAQTNCSVIALKSTEENANGWTAGDGALEEGYARDFSDQKKGLEVWMARSVEISDMEAPSAARTRTGRLGRP